MKFFQTLDDTVMKHKIYAFFTLGSIVMAFGIDTHLLSSNNELAPLLINLFIQCMGSIILMDFVSKLIFKENKQEVTKNENHNTRVSPPDNVTKLEKIVLAGSAFLTLGSCSLNNMITQDMPFSQTATNLLHMIGISSAFLTVDLVLLGLRKQKKM